MSMSMWTIIENVEDASELIPDGYGDGSSLPRHLDTLNEFARSLNLTPLEDFTLDFAAALEALMQDESIASEDLEEAIRGIGDGGPWYAPEDGLSTLNGLIGNIDGLTGAKRASLDNALLDLRAFAAQLEYARENGRRFFFGIEY